MYTHVKRLADVSISAVTLVILLPVFILVGLVIKLDSRGPVLFRQNRWGKDRTVFECLKFRTMSVDAPSAVATRNLKGAKNYITRSGRILRRIGLDELPQLINVLKGEMSLIGPRPVVLAETDLIDERDKYGANAMVPGIGGWAQSNGRDTVGVKEKARLDGEYAQNFSLKMDISCVWRTVVAIFTSEGFKEGHLGDTAYKHEVEARTKKIALHKRVYRKMKRVAVRRSAPGRASTGARVINE